MTQSTVALVRCATYDADLVYEALSRGVELLGGIDRFVTPGERILLKPNLLAGTDPDEAVTTHPSVLAASARLFKKGGAAVCFGDSPGLDRPARAAEQAGLMEAGIRSGADFVDFSSGSRLDYPEGALVSSFPIAEPVRQCDAMVNLAKMKTHQLTRITGAVKNLFGSVPGRRKALYHVQFQDPMAFCTLLVELNLRLRPRLHIIDGIVAMEGNGPRSGDPRPMRVLMLSSDPVALDAAFCRIVALDPHFVPTNVIGQRRGLGRFEKQKVAFVGDSLESFVDPDFKVIRKPVYGNASYAHYNLIKSAILPRPVIDAGRCVRCGRCVEACPVPDKALRFEDGRDQPPRYDYTQCIRCYCCQEMCPERAIDTVTPLLGRVLQLLR